MAQYRDNSWMLRNYGNPGAPGSEVGRRYASEHIVVVTIGRGRKVTCHEAVARHVKWMDKMMRDVAPRYWEKIDDFLDDWGYSHRYIAGTTTLSKHSWGTAIDWDATKNVRKPGGAFSSAIWQEARAAVLKAESHGWYWGGRFSTPDAMHFEETLTPRQIRARIDKDGNWRTRQERAEWERKHRL